jgi:hypothetical protein
MTAFRLEGAGDYTGGFLIFPQWRIAVNMMRSDVLLFSSSDWHGNSPIFSEGPYERISIVCYYRLGMLECGTAQEELAKALQQKP